MPVEESPQKTSPSNLKYSVTCSDKLGRYIIATKDIAPGEVILREEPAAVGPTTFNKHFFCFDCMRLLPTVNGNVQYVCSKCHIAPLCSAACENHSGHHTSEECEIIRNNNNLLKENIRDIIGVLLPLRLWILKQKNFELWEKINSMEAHLEKRRDSSVWNEREINVVKVNETLQLIPNDNDESSSEEFLQKLCGILDVNTFELRSPGGLDDMFLRGLYTEAALMAHDCRGNTHLTVDDNFRLTVYASLPIVKDQAILFNYTSPLLGTSDRREYLREGKYFECECSMCKDPTEMGSHLSTLLCPRCKKGFVVLQNPLEMKLLNRKTAWKCESCKKCYSTRLIRATLEITRTMIEQVDDTSMHDLENLITKLLKSFHPNHSLVLALKQKLLAVYRKEIASINPQKKIIQKMLDLCKEVYEVLDIVEPGLSRLKGILLYEMHLPLAILANRNYAAREITTEELVMRLDESKHLLRKALTMLLLEPADTPEGRLAKRALQELRILNQNISDAKLLPPEAPRKQGRKTKDDQKRR